MEKTADIPGSVHVRAEIFARLKLNVVVFITAAFLILGSWKVVSTLFLNSKII